LATWAHFLQKESIELFTPSFFLSYQVVDIFIYLHQKKKSQLFLLGKQHNILKEKTLKLGANRLFNCSPRIPKLPQGLKGKP
jgi:hypothetical protein